MNTAIVWFRRDLRLSDHPALEWASTEFSKIIPVYIHAPEEEANWISGTASRWWLHNSLLSLKAALGQRGLNLSCYSGGSARVLAALARDEGVSMVVANRLYEPHLSQRDQELKRHLDDLGIEVRYFDSDLLFPPGQILNQQGKPYRVFSPFWRRARRILEINPPQIGMPFARAEQEHSDIEARDGNDVDSLGLLDANRWHLKLKKYWSPGERGASSQLQDFLDNGLSSYERGREIPGNRGTAGLSPHLHFGEITSRQVFHALFYRLQSSNRSETASIECFISQLGWREFAYQILWHFPESSSQSMNPLFKDSFWHQDGEFLEAWQSGNTGVPLIDAAMNELWETGWMHNRMRMVVGSFLTKNLGIHWQAGARWFWDTLVDADLANNSMGWQWIAGCGVDAAPYYRVFNPELQAKKFDPNGRYITRWLGTQRECQPLVDLAASREAALARYGRLKKGNSGS